MVVGAGCGPLVRITFRQTFLAKAHYAVEKNPNAVITLRHMAIGESTWNSRVTVVAAI